MIMKFPLLYKHLDKNHNMKSYMNSNVHCSTICNSQDIEATQMSINQGMDKQDVVHTCWVGQKVNSGFSVRSYGETIANSLVNSIQLLSHQKKTKKQKTKLQNNAICAAWVELEIVIHREVSQTKTNRI